MDVDSTFRYQYLALFAELVYEAKLYKILQGAVGIPYVRWYGVEVRSAGEVCFCCESCAEIAFGWAPAANSFFLSPLFSNEQLDLSNIFARAFTSAGFVQRACHGLAWTISRRSFQPLRQAILLGSCSSPVLCTPATLRKMLYCAEDCAHDR